jgi:prevent-host-death family protein
MRHVPLAAFKDRASEFIAAAERGEEIIVTRHGKPAARITTAVDREERQRRTREALIGLADLRAKMRKGGRTATLEEVIGWKNEGRR